MSKITLQESSNRVCIELCLQIELAVKNGDVEKVNVYSMALQRIRAASI